MTLTPRTFALFHTVLLAAVTGALFGGLAWLITGTMPTWWAIVLIGEVAWLAGGALLKSNRTLEQESLRAAFDAPAFGDDGPAGGVR